MGGLLRSVFKCKNITPALRQLAPELSLDIKNKKKGKQLTEEERMMMPPGKINDQEDFIDAILNVIDVDLPMRHFTLRFYSHFLQNDNLLNQR